MKTYYSIISYLNNFVSDEKIAFGFILTNNENSMVRFSSSKIRLIKHINEKAYGLLKSSLNNFDISLNNFSAIESNIDLVEKLQRLSTYEQGILHYSSPKILNEEISNEVFNLYFNKWIENNINVLDESFNEIKRESKFKVSLSNNFKPLKEKIDINYTVNKEKIPELFFNFQLDAIAANGSLITAKAIDLENLTRTSVENNIARYKLLLDCLIPFAEDKLNLHSGHETFLIINKPIEKTENEEIYYKLKNSNHYNLKILEVANIDHLNQVISKNGVGKFSERLQDIY